MARDPDDPGTDDLFDTRPKGFPPVTQRILEAAHDIGLDRPEDIAYQHTVLCQTCLPYRAPKPDVRAWERSNGRVALRIEAGSGYHPEHGFQPQPLPAGPKARLILMHLNAEALRQRSAVIEVEDSLTAFVRTIQGSEPNGREIRRFKEQLAALSVATIRLAVATDDQRARQINTQIVTGLDVWAPKDDRQRILWPSTVALSAEYYESLTRHAVPLDMRAVAALSHSAMALDILAWLSQRLHRVPVGKPAFVPWTALQWQFGEGYAQIRFFRRVFKVALRQALATYPGAKVELDQHGMTLRHSPPPVAPRHQLTVPREF
jgi:hypothetical protein